METPLLQVSHLAASFRTEAGVAKALDDVSFTVQPRQTLGIVGESGCGKSVTALSIMRLLPRPAGKIDDGQVLFKGDDIFKMPQKDMHKIRGNRISMIFQEPMTALNPVYKVGRQLAETFRLHFPKMQKSEIQAACVDMLRKVGIPAPERRLQEFPHQLSGGMRQRVMIAIALACEPDILIADEPTTALDVTTQAQILDLMKTLQRDTGMAIIFITHDLGVIAEVCDAVVVMYAGRVAERASVFDLFDQPRHPYTQGLLASIPRLDGERKSILPTIPGMVPSLFEMPAGCRFANRCPHVQPQCQQTVPKIEQVKADHWVRCLRHEELV